ncbi:MAG: glutaredoxin family protein [Candidatus Hadarchaeum sp.]|uniref:glutaredoxin family protein n=1 Tax=Candidatus Hadarchaeum sp. TaxID=2883567 RepID=UPI00317D19CE
MNHVEGKKRGRIFLFALSTCVWCAKTKKLLDDLGVDYYYVDVDLLKGESREEALKEMERWNPKRSFPTLVINDRHIVGFDEKKIKEALAA